MNSQESTNEKYKRKSLSSFAEFLIETRGMSIQHKGKSLDKWEAFEMGLTIEQISS